MAYAESNAARIALTTASSGRAYLSVVDTDEWPRAQAMNWRKTPREATVEAKV
jgi:hypothetical protein